MKYSCEKKLSRHISAAAVAAAVCVCVRMVLHCVNALKKKTYVYIIGAFCVRDIRFLICVVHCVVTIVFHSPAVIWDRKTTE